LPARLLEATRAALSFAVHRRRRRALAKTILVGDRKLSNAFRQQGRAFLSRLATQAGRFGTAEALREGANEVPDWEPLFTQAALETLSIFEGPISTIARQALEAGLRVAMADLKTTIAFDLKHPKAVAYLEDHGADLVTKINDTTRSRVRTIMTQAVDEGWSYNRTAKELKALYDGFSVGKPQKHIQSRAHLIAVTESGEAYEHGNMLVGQELAAAGLDMQKSWNSVGDERVSPECRANEAAGWIPLADAYPSGKDRPLQHPACRCAGLIRLAPDKKA